MHPLKFKYTVQRTEQLAKLKNSPDTWKEFLRTAVILATSTSCWQSANILHSRNPKAVMLCLHADDCVADDVLRMHFALMKAYCWENTIPLMKVNLFLCTSSEFLSHCKWLIEDWTHSKVMVSTVLPGIGEKGLLSCIWLNFPTKCWCQSTSP